MTIPALISQYLYENYRLALPGLGSFVYVPDADSIFEQKKNKVAPTGVLSFENEPAIKENQDLVNYISAKTGKIKALAAADLQSYLELAKQFLNIGKSFLFEGIGSLKKNQDGTFSLVTDSADEIFRDVSAKDTKTKSADESDYSGFRNILKPIKQKMSWRKPAIVFLIAAGLGLSIWGGYTVYKFTTSKNKNSSNGTADKEIKPVERMTTRIDNTTDTTTQTINSAGQSNISNSFKFIVEVANKERAISRYNHLQAIGVHQSKLETRDSVTFNIYFQIAASINDTARIIDSLRRNYTPAGKQAFVVANY